MLSTQLRPRRCRGDCFGAQRFLDSSSMLKPPAPLATPQPPSLALSFAAPFCHKRHQGKRDRNCEKDKP